MTTTFVVLAACSQDLVRTPPLHLSSEVSDCVDLRPAAVESPWSLQVLTGYYVLANGDTARQAIGQGGRTLHFDYGLQTFRLERTTFSSVFADTPFRGSTSLLFEFNGAVVTRDFGNYFAGPSVLGRYSLGTENAAVRPYIQCGLGLVYTDANRERTQRIIGGDVEFLLQSQVGVRIPLNDRWSLDVEGGVHHISNANTRSRNIGANTLGGSAGVTYRFGGRRR
jgi:hypothetical protein